MFDTYLNTYKKTHAIMHAWTHASMHYDGFPKRRKQQLDSFYFPRKIEPLLPLFTKKEGRKDFVIISTHHFQIAFSHPMFAGWAATSCVERKKAKSRGKEICGQVRYNLPVQTSSMFNCFQHPRQICISYMPPSIAVT